MINIYAYLKNFLYRSQRGILVIGIVFTVEEETQHWPQGGPEVCG